MLTRLRPECEAEDRLITHGDFVSRGGPQQQSNGALDGETFFLPNHHRVYDGDH